MNRNRLDINGCSSTLHNAASLSEVKKADWCSSYQTLHSSGTREEARHLKETCQTCSAPHDKESQSQKISTQRFETFLKMEMCSLFSVVLLIYYVSKISTLAQRTSQRDDVMGTYFLMNRYQCERLCWYRKLCKTYSYTYNRTLATDGNCVLHADNFAITTKNVSTGWIDMAALWNVTLQDNGCRIRPCSDTQVCVPTFDSPFYKCLAFAAECQAPTRDDGVYNNVTLVQGQSTTFTCNSSLVWVPRHANMTVTCHVNGKYSGLNGTCKNATYYSPNVPFNKPLPDVVMEGWEACIKGNFTGSRRMSFNFHDRQNASCDSSPAGGGNIYLCLDFRYELKVKQKVFYFTGLNKCSWSSGGEIGNLPLQPNDYFEITLRILYNNTMQIIYKNLTTQQLDLVSNNINLTNATYLEVTRDVKLSYVNLGRGCD